MNKTVKGVLKVLGIAALALVLVVAGYLCYVVFNHSRIEDSLALEVTKNASDTVKPGEHYTVLTQNIGFGAYRRPYL